MGIYKKLCMVCLLVLPNVMFGMTDQAYADQKTKLDQTFKEKKEVKFGDVLQTLLKDISIPGFMKDFLNTLVIKDPIEVPIPTIFRSGVSYKGKVNILGKDVSFQVMLAKKIYEEVLGKEELSKKPLFAVIIDLPTDWKFSDLSPELKFLDLLKIYDAKLLLSLFKFKDTTIGATFYEGVNISARVDASQVKIPGLQQVLETISAFAKPKVDLTKLLFMALLVPETKKTDSLLGKKLGLAGDTSFRLKIPTDIAVPIQDPLLLDGITLKSIEIGFKPLSDGVILKTGLLVDIKKADPIKVSIEGGVKPTAVKLAGYTVGKYSPAFRLPWLSFDKLGVQAGIDFKVAAALRVPVTSLGFRGIGEIGKGDDAIKADFASSVELKSDEAPKILFYANITELPFSKLIRLLSQMAGKEIPLKDIPVFSIKPVKIIVIPQRTEIASKVYEQGYIYEGGFDLFGLKGSGLFFIKGGDVTEYKLQGRGRIDNIDLSPLFKFTGVGPDKKAGTKDDGPIIQFDISTLKQRLFMDGVMEIPVLMMKQQTTMDMTQTKLFAKIEADMLAFLRGTVDMNIPTLLFKIKDGKLVWDEAKLKELIVKVNVTSGFEKIEQQLTAAFKKLKDEASKGIAVPGLKEAAQALISTVDKISQYALKAQPVSIKSISATLDGTNLKSLTLPKFDFMLRLEWLGKDITISSTMDPEDVPKMAESLAQAILDEIVESPLADLFKQIGEGFEELGLEIAGAVESVVKDLTPIWNRTQQAINEYKKKLEEFFKDVEDTINEIFGEKKAAGEPAKPKQITLTKTEIEGVVNAIFSKATFNQDNIINSANALGQAVSKTIKFTNQYVTESKKVISSLTALVQNISGALKGGTVTIQTPSSQAKTSLAYFSDLFALKQEMLDAIQLNTSRILLTFESLMQAMKTSQELSTVGDTFFFWVNNKQNMFASVAELRKLINELTPKFKELQTTAQQFVTDSKNLTQTLDTQIQNDINLLRTSNPGELKALQTQLNAITNTLSQSITAFANQVNALQNEVGILKKASTIRALLTNVITKLNRPVESKKIATEIAFRVGVSLLLEKSFYMIKSLQKLFWTFKILLEQAGIITTQYQSLIALQQKLRDAAKKEQQKIEQEKLKGAAPPAEKPTPQEAINLANTMQKQLEANPILKQALNTITQESLAQLSIDFNKAFDHVNTNLFGNARNAALYPLNGLWRSSVVQQRIEKLDPNVQKLIAQKNYAKAIEDAKTIDDPNWKIKEATQKATEGIKQQIQPPKFSF